MRAREGRQRVGGAGNEAGRALWREKKMLNLRGVRFAEGGVAVATELPYEGAELIMVPPPERKGPPKVLVVDDNPDNVDILRQLLETRGYEVCSELDGSKVVERAQQEQPDAILLDVHMPGRDGFEICRELKVVQSTRDIPVVLVTAVYLDEQNMISGLEAGAYDYIIKPFRPAELLARIAVMVRIKEAQDYVKRLSVTDDLTGLYNRRFFFARLEEEVRRARRHGIPLSCAILDIDHFKRINDKYGHPFGDRVIREVGAMLASKCRLEDVAARIGGEEYSLLAPNTSLEGAVSLLCRLMDEIRAHEFRDGSISVRATVSAGVAELEPGMTSEELVQRADQALYRAKQQGRDRLVPWGEE